VDVGRCVGVGGWVCEWVENTRLFVQGTARWCSRGVKGNAWRMNVCSRVSNELHEIWNECQIVVGGEACAWVPHVLLWSEEVSGVWRTTCSLVVREGERGPCGRTAKKSLSKPYVAEGESA
jgi:hypothetical protein